MEAASHRVPSRSPRRGCRSRRHSSSGAHFSKCLCLSSPRRRRSSSSPPPPTFLSFRTPRHLRRARKVSRHQPPLPASLPFFFFGSIDKLSLSASQPSFALRRRPLAARATNEVAWPLANGSNRRQERCIHISHTHTHKKNASQSHVTSGEGRTILLLRFLSLSLISPPPSALRAAADSSETRGKSPLPSAL